MRKRYEWDDAKSEKLKRERGVSFEEVYYMVEHGRVLDVITHPNQKKYPGQKMFVLRIKNYVWTVPFVETDEKIFLKTAMPSRKLTKKYIAEAQQTDEES